MIVIDGSYGEGGGSIIRTSLALSMLSSKPFTISNIRINRPNPGLKPQHLNAVLAAKKLCDATVEDASINSQKIIFKPNEVKPQTLSVDIGTAGSITLLLQALLPPSVFAHDKIRLRITGGTDTKWSMPIDYFRNVLLPRISHLAKIQTEVIQRGYYPRGGGKVDIKIQPKQQSENFNLLERGTIQRIDGISHASSELRQARVAERQLKAAKQTLSKMDCNLKIKTEYCKTLSKGSGLTLWATSDTGSIVGADSLGEQGKRAEIVGRQAATNLLNQLNKDAPVDLHLADQLIPFLAATRGKYKTTEITNHTLTNIYVVNQFLPNRISVDIVKRIITS